jgi:RNase P subunit RPR2
MTDRIEEIKGAIPKTLEKWQCLACHSTLGYVENKTTVRIKRKDLYIRINGGDVEVICYKCGKTNCLHDETNLPKGDITLREQH